MARPFVEVGRSDSGSVFPWVVESRTSDRKVSAPVAGAAWLLSSRRSAGHSGRSRGRGTTSFLHALRRVLDNRFQIGRLRRRRGQEGDPAQRILRENAVEHEDVEVYVEVQAAGAMNERDRAALRLDDPAAPGPRT